MYDEDLVDDAQLLLLFKCYCCAICFEFVFEDKNNVDPTKAMDPRD